MELNLGNAPYLTYCLFAYLLLTMSFLPPTTLSRWRIFSEASCFLCHKEVCTAAHILGSYKKALSQGRFTFRHDSILKDLVEQIKSFLSDIHLTASKKVSKSSFVKAGKCVAKSNKKPTGLLHLTSDWVLL